MTRRIELRDLAYSDLIFLKTLYESNSLKTTAGILDTSIPHASRRLSKLRTLFDDVLFVRSSPCMIASARMTEIYQRIAPMMQALEELAPEHGFDPRTISRTFHIAGVDNAFFCVMPRVVHALFELAPNARLDLRTIEDSLLSDLENGSLDLAIYPSHKLPVLFHSQDLYPCAFVFVTKANHPLHRYYLEHGSLPLNEIEKYRKIRLTNRPVTSSPLFSLDEMNLTGQPNQQDLAISVPYFLTVPVLLEQTDFTAVLPEQTALKLMDLGCPLAILPYCSTNANRYSTRIVWHERVDRDPAIQWLRGLFAMYATRQTD